MPGRQTTTPAHRARGLRTGRPAPACSQRSPIRGPALRLPRPRYPARARLRHPGAATESAGQDSSTQTRRRPPARK
ncbi:hypothetical protein G6F31_021844 [Rhizopus arrhizus]|nr:hypothetical protein G6F31_021844 [Rhizopus arrhizus]